MAPPGGLIFEKGKNGVRGSCSAPGGEVTNYKIRERTSGAI